MPLEKEKNKYSKGGAGHGVARLSRSCTSFRSFQLLYFQRIHFVELKTATSAGYYSEVLHSSD